MSAKGNTMRVRSARAVGAALCILSAMLLTGCTQFQDGSATGGRFCPLTGCQ